AALEVMSRWALDPCWLIYLPPTMSPSETSLADGFLEHPAEALAYYRKQGIERVVCEEKHMGSRAIFIICRDEAAARKQFGASEGEIGVCYTRTGRRFFDDDSLETAFLDRLRTAAVSAGLFDELSSDWLLLDCELMPWSAKAQELLRRQYAAVGAASRAGLEGVTGAVGVVAGRGLEVGELLESAEARVGMASKYVEAYGRYCWPVGSVGDLKLAPFHLLATEGHVYVDKDHVWHMETLAGVCKEDQELMIVTEYRVADVNDDESVREGVRWWEEKTDRGGEGMVVKPYDFIAPGRHGIAQPAVKCRGREYLRIIYGPEYTAPENLERLRSRGLSAKRGLAQREFALGVEALERFVAGEPLRRVHECVFGVLALESEPVDPRL
ncbi:MAG: polynucleotide kinase-phosphatase, partial [Chloroflexia bacterium]